MRPSILIVNDDERLCATRRLLLESCGAKVYTACGRASKVREELGHELDLVLIDSTNVGMARGEQLCDLVKSVSTLHCVALLAAVELGMAEPANADFLIPRSGPRELLVRTNELLDRRLDINLWESTTKHGNNGTSC